MTEDPLHRANRWKPFYVEEGGLKDILAFIGETLLKRMSQVEPWENEKLANLAIANKITQQIDAMVQAIINDGKVQEHVQKRVKMIEAIPHKARRFI